MSLCHIISDKNIDLPSKEKIIQQELAYCKTNQLRSLPLTLVLSNLKLYIWKVLRNSPIKQILKIMHLTKAKEWSSRNDATILKTKRYSIVRITFWVFPILFKVIAHILQELFKLLDSFFLLLLEGAWCNGYRFRKWTQQSELKSWMKLFGFHFALIPFRDTWIHLFSPPSYG